MTYQSGRRRHRPQAESRGAGHRGRHLCGPHPPSPLGSVHGRHPWEAQEAEEAAARPRQLHNFCPAPAGTV